MSLADSGFVCGSKQLKSQVGIDLTAIKEVKILDHRPTSIRTGDKWKYVVSAFGAERVLIIYHGCQFVLSVLVLACDCLPTHATGVLLIFSLFSRGWRNLPGLVGRPEQPRP